AFHRRRRTRRDAPMSRDQIAPGPRRVPQYRRPRCQRAKSLAGVEVLEQRCLLALTITPTTLADANTTPGIDSLREAVVAANATFGADPVTIQLASGVYSLTIPNDALTGQENAALRGDLDITNTLHPIVIVGQGSSGPNATIIDQTTLDRVFHVMPD